MNTLYLVLVAAVMGGVHGYSRTPSQYHIQTDEGPDRYFRFQTYTGQYRKEKRLDDGTVFGTYGWVDATGLLRLYDYIADDDGYRIVRTRRVKVGVVNPAAYQHLADRQPWNPQYRPKGQQQQQPLTQQVQQQDQQPSQPVQQQQKRPWQQTQQKQRPWQSQQQQQQKQQQQQQQQQRPWQKTQPQQTQQASTPSQAVAGGSVPAHDPADPSDLPAGGSFSINYDLGNQFHVEKLYADGRKVGRHGYVDPLGILRVSHYTAGPEGLVQRQESRWVGSRDPYTL